MKKSVYFPLLYVSCFTRDAFNTWVLLLNEMFKERLFVCFLVWKVWGICLRVWEGNVREGPVLQPDHCALGSHFCSSLFIDVKFSNKCHKQMAYFQGVVGTDISAAFQPISPNYWVLLNSAWVAGSGGHHATDSIVPQELGPISIRADGKITTDFISASFKCLDHLFFR